MNQGLIIRKATLAEFATPVGWAASEGWNPGLDDLGPFFAADPEGFLMGWKEGEPVSSISVVRYGADIGFLGFYIVHPDHRGKGIGLATWQAGMAHLANRTVGLDGVVDQQANYAQSGFTLFGRNIRYSGIPHEEGMVRTHPQDEYSVSPATIEHRNDILRLDQQCFGAERSAFVSEWCLPNLAASRSTLVIKKDDRLVGFGTIRKCHAGYKIGPLFCDDPSAAQPLFTALIASCDHGAEISIDVPLTNDAAIHLAENRGLAPSFETARMYAGSPPKIQWNAVFGITSLELG